MVINPETPGDFGLFLRLAREEAGLSRDQLAKRVGLDVSHIFRIETGGRRPSRDAVLALAEALSLDENSTNRWLVAAGYAPIAAFGVVREAVRARGAVRTRGAIPGRSPWDASARVKRLESIGLTESTVTRLLDAMSAAGLAEQQEAAGAISNAFSRVAESLETPVRAAVIPAAGGQHRLLAAHVMQRLLLGAIAEAVQCGIRNIVLVLAPGSVEPLFVPLKEALDLAVVPAVRLRCCEQPKPAGLGDAILHAEDFVEKGPLAVLLPDDAVRERAGRPLGRELRRMIAALKDLAHASLVAVCSVPKTRLAHGGAARLSPKEIRPRVFPILELAEKPGPEAPISNARNVFGIVGRYLFQPAIFDALRDLDGRAIRPLELTDAAAALLSGGARVHAYEMEAKRRDIGTVLDEASGLIGNPLPGYGPRP